MSRYVLDALALPCLALTIEQQAIAVTADKAWAQLNIGVGIQVIR
jgi:PIN domain nuclease of toxin-antitoxin system